MATATPASPKPSPHAATLRRAADFLGQGRAQQAHALLRPVLAKSPADPLACRLMASTLLALGQPEPAAYHAEKALKSLPDNPDLLNLLGNAQHLAGKLGDAEATLRKAVELEPRHAPNLAALARTLAQAGKHEEAVETAVKALAVAPGSASLVQICAGSLATLGQTDAAVNLLQQATAADPQNPALLSLLCATMNYAPSVPPRDLGAAHRAFGRLMLAQMPRRIEFPADRFDPGRPLRVGVLAVEFRRHAFMHFFRPLIERFDRSQLSLHLYQHSPIEDAVSAEYKAAEGVRWKNTAHLPPLNLASAIAEDRIDVLIDACGHVNASAMMALHIRPAPVIASWLNYPCTTGLEAVDYRLVDADTDPDGAEALGVEKLLRLDHGAMVYRIPPEAPEPGPCPSAGGGPITFGSFSSAAKLNDATLRRWARVLQAVPGSRLIIKHHGLENPAAQASLSRRLDAAGFPRPRVELLPPDHDLRVHLGSYGRIDVALDTHPYAAVTTAFEALTMGVPLVTRTHPTSAGRGPVGALRTLGLTDLVTDTDDAFVAAAASIAGDLPRRTELRRTLRTTLASSPLCDEQGWVDRFTAAIRRMWQERCR